MDAWEQMSLSSSRAWTPDQLHVTRPWACPSPPAPSDPGTPASPNTATLPACPPPPLHAPTPQLAHTHTGCCSTRTPRGHGLQDDLYHIFTRDAYLSSGTAAARELAGTLNIHPYTATPAATTTTTTTTTIPPAITATAHSAVNKSRPHPQRRLKRPRRSPSPLPSRPPPAKRPKPAAAPSQELHFVDDSLFATLNAAMMEIASRQLAPHHQPITAASSKLSFKDTTWTFPKKLKKKRRRPSDLFNINFGFGFSSRRRQSSDDSPHVSPRTSISSPSASPRADLMESFKRQRIDSTGSDMHQPEDPHPGQLVDFSLSPASLALHAPPTPAPVPAPPTMLPLPELSTDFNTRPTTDAYDDYLAATTTTTTHRRNSFPAVDWDNAAATTKELLEIDPKDTTTITTTTVAPLPAQPLEASKCELRRTTSDPSTERFLTHIRASLEARRSKSGRTWQTYPVFADEVEKGFLDDAPL